MPMLACLDKIVIDFGAFELQLSPTLFGTICIVLGSLLLLLTHIIGTVIIKEKAPMAYPEAGIGGSLLHPISSVRIARFVEEGRYGAIQIELNPESERFHVFLYQVGTKRGKAFCKYRRRIVVDPKVGDAKAYLRVKDRKANAFAIVRDHSAAHNHISTLSLILGPLFYGLGFFASMLLALYGLAIFRNNWADENNKFFSMGFYFPTLHSFLVLGIATLLVIIFIFLIAFFAGHEGRRKAK